MQLSLRIKVVSFYVLSHIFVDIVLYFTDYGWSIVSEIIPDLRAQRVTLQEDITIRVGIVTKDVATWSTVTFVHITSKQ
jgi:hypothetical protein